MSLSDDPVEHIQMSDYLEKRFRWSEQLLYDDGVGLSPDLAGSAAADALACLMPSWKREAASQDNLDGLGAIIQADLDQLIKQLQHARKSLPERLTRFDILTF